MTLRRRHGLARSGLDFTSLVDIALVLVVYFLLASQTAASRDLPVTLPQAGTGQQAATDTIELVVDRGGTVSHRGRTVELKELAALVGKSRRVTLLADSEARHGRVVEVVDVLRRAGVPEVYYATAPKVEEW
jgi:biopolymer transport protein ExbD